MSAVREVLMNAASIIYSRTSTIGDVVSFRIIAHDSWITPESTMIPDTLLNESGEFHSVLFPFHIMSTDEIVSDRWKEYRREYPDDSNHYHHLNESETLLELGESYHTYQGNGNEL